MKCEIYCMKTRERVGRESKVTGAGRMSSSSNQSTVSCGKTPFQLQEIAYN